MGSTLCGNRSGFWSGRDLCTSLRARCLSSGAALRRDGQRADARDALRRALEVAHRCGAGGLEKRTREEFAAVGSRPRSAFGTGVASLTASEQRIAKLAAEGLNNREIAERLFISRSTVETHLGHAYRKLGISGRAELRTALAELDQGHIHPRPPQT